MKNFVKQHRGLTAAIVGFLAFLTLGAGGCDNPAPKSGAQGTGQTQTEKAFKQQSDAVKYPVSELRDSQERRNLREKLLRFNSPSKIGYLYLFSDTGQVVNFYTVKGKVSSAQSQMTTDQLVSADLNRRDGSEHVVTNAPGDDGSYGENERGIFFFTTEGVFVEVGEMWKWQYLDAPLELHGSTLNVSLSNSSKPSSAVEIGK